MLKRILTVSLLGILLCLFLYATIEDQFGGDLSKWTQTFGSWAIDTGELVEDTTINTNTSIIYSAEATTGADHWVRAKYTHPGGQYAGLILRGDAGQANCYGIAVTGTIFRWYVIDTTDGSSVDNVQTITLAHSSGDYIGFRVSGTGNSTEIEIWADCDGAWNTDPTQWGAADDTFTDNPGPAVDTNNYVGCVCYQGSTSAVQFDDFFAGPVAAGNGDGDGNAVFIGANFSRKRK